LARKSFLTSAIGEINVRVIRELRRVFGPDRLSVPNRSTCGSAGIYNIIQPAMSQRLLSRKLGHIEKTGAAIVAAANPGCHLQIENGAKAKRQKIQVLHPVSLLAMAYRAETR
jgi:glycolate oxidase iron-sulfur subunit